jgi:integrase
MINRENWIDVKAYLAHQSRIGRDPETVARIRVYLNHLLYWADNIVFPKVRNLEPSFPVYLNSSRRDGQDKTLAVTTIKKTCEYVRLFFEFAREEYPIRYKAIRRSWIDTIRPTLSKGGRTEWKEHSYYPIEMLRQIAATPVTTLKQERDRAAACFLYLSAMRAQAFVSLPMRCVDIQTYSIRQIPKEGVRTKNRIAAITQVARISGLLDVVRSWDEKVREINTYPNGLWYPPLDRDGNVKPQDNMNWISRVETLRENIQSICKLAGVPYMPPHDFRDGHIVHMVERVKTVEELKAVSQNAMHGDIAITQGIYGRLTSDHIKKVYDKYIDD